jgi:hypothetical protein
LLAIVDAVFTAEGRQEVMDSVEPEKNGYLPRAEAGAVSAIVCPPPIDAGGPGDVSRPNFAPKCSAPGRRVPGDGGAPVARG